MKIPILLATGWMPVVVAQIVNQPTGDVSGLLTGSAVTILGTGIIAFTKGWVVAGKSYDRLEKKYDAAIEQLRLINEDNRKEFMPLMARFNDAASKFMDQFLIDEMKRTDHK